MKVFLDDERDTPEGWTRVKTPEEAIELLKTDRVTHLSLDHDLGLSDDRTGYAVLLWIEKQCEEVGFLPPHITIHSANAGAWTRMDAAVESIEMRAHYVRRSLEIDQLFDRLKAELPALEELFAHYTHKWVYEDAVYRFYHQSFKVYDRQSDTLAIVAKLQSLAPHRPLNRWFMEIVRDGTGKTFKTQDNEKWLAVTRPIVEAFFHARFFLEMAVIYGRELETPRTLPTGWAAFLYLYDLRE